MNYETWTKLFLVWKDLIRKLFAWLSKEMEMVIFIESLKRSQLK